MLVIIALRRLKQDYLEFKVNLGNIVNVYLNNNSSNFFFCVPSRIKQQGLYISYTLIITLSSVFFFIVVILC